MKIVPVIDLLAGRAVWARRGERSEYRPVNSPLCAAGEVFPLVDRLVERFAIGTLYLADLDAIQRLGDNLELLTSIHERHPQLELWVDAGFKDPEELKHFSRHAIGRPVIGSESWLSADSLHQSGALLSIDRDSAGLRDPSGITSEPQRWPEDLILMNLSRVGAGEGPDLQWLQEWQRRVPESPLYMAGGVRDVRDLAQLADAGAAGVLLASALHQGTLSAADLRPHG